MNTIKEIKNIILKMSLQQLQLFLIQNIQQCSNDEQIEALESLKSILYPLPSLNWEEIDQWVKNIEEGEIYFEEDEEYYNYYDCEDIRVLDPHHIMKQVNHLIKNAELAIYHHQFETSKKCLNILLTTNFQLFGDFGVNEIELYEYELMDKTQFVYLLNLYFMVNYELNFNNCLSELYSMSLRYSNCLNLADTLVPSWDSHFDSKQIIDEWLDYFKNHIDSRNSKQCIYLCEYLNDEQRWHDVACELCHQYPSFAFETMKHLLENKKFDFCESLGKACLNKISLSQIIRGDIAKLASCASKEMKHDDLYRLFLAEAFYSHSSFNHFIDCYLNDVQVEEIYHYAVHLSQNPAHDVHENNITNATLAMMTFLCVPLQHLMIEEFFHDFDFSLVHLILVLLDQTNQAHHYLKCDCDCDKLMLLKQCYTFDKESIPYLLTAIHQKIWKYSEYILKNTERHYYKNVAIHCVIFDSIAQSFHVNCSLLKQCKQAYPHRPAFNREVKKYFEYFPSYFNA